MNRRRLIVALAALVAILIFVAAREAASWRPKAVGQIRSLNPTRQTLQFSLDSQFLLTQGNVNNEPIFLWDAAKWRKVRELPQGKWMVSRDFRIAARIEDQSRTNSLLQMQFRPVARLFDLRNGPFLRQVSAPDSLDYNWISDAQFTPDGRRFWLVTRRYFYQFDAINGRMLQRVKPQFQAQFSALSPDTGQILRDFDGLTWICQTDNGQMIRALPHSAQGRASWSPDGKICWQTQPGGRGFRFWNAQTGAIIRAWNAPAFTQIHFTPDSKNLVVATPNGLELRDVSTGKLVQTLRGPRAEPFALAPDGSFAVSLDKAGTLWKWRLQ